MSLNAKPPILSVLSFVIMSKVVTSEVIISIFIVSLGDIYSTDFTDDHHLRFITEATRINYKF